MDRSTEGPRPCKPFSFFTANLLPWVRHRAFQRLLTSPAAAVGLAMALAQESALRQGPGGDVAGWIVIATLLSCDSICSAFRARKGHDAVLAHSEQPAAFWGVRGWTSEMCQAEQGSQTEHQQ